MYACMYVCVCMYICIHVCMLFFSMEMIILSISNRLCIAVRIFIRSSTANSLLEAKSRDLVTITVW